jgi:pyruvate/2-oxoglutarate dehydrogenase complex dihydrolipoamide acyltransferase (E2) component
MRVEGEIVRFGPKKLFDEVPKAFANKFEPVEIVEKGAEILKTASEAAKKLAEENDIDLDKVEATGKNNVITKADVQAYLEEKD